MCGLGASLRQFVELACSKSMRGIAARYSQQMFVLRIMYFFSQIQNGQTPWGCASDEILEMFKSAGVLDCGYESHGDISHVGADTVRCGI